MSSADSLLTAVASDIVKDVWMEYLHPDREHDEKKLLVLARVTTGSLDYARAGYVVAISHTTVEPRQ